MISDLEKKLFESERERIALRRERDEVERECRLAEDCKIEVTEELINMVRDNQKRIEESNKAMLEMIGR